MSLDVHDVHDVHIVSHTHWDREWYHPVERFRQKLVALVDELLDEPLDERRAADDSFLLDGQAIVIDDYLAVRPERAELLGAKLRSGQLAAGPWYVLGDELIPSGEAMVRNLHAGARVLRRFNAAAPPVLYCPDSFGHPAVLPAIASGFGLPLIILWRAYGGRHSPAGDTARWVAPNGEAAVLFHLPRDGYEFGSHLPTDAAGAAARWARMRDELLPRSTTGVTLVPNGADHHAPQVGHRNAIAALEKAGGRDGVHRSSLTDFANAVMERATEDTLPIVRGELRDSYGYTWTIQGTFATRAHEKRLNARAERLLLREAEPWSALAARRGSSRLPLVNAAWRTLLEAHPHDTLCGCSIDEVAAAMELRLRSATNQARGIVEDSVMDLIGHDPVAARGARDRWQPIVVVRNAAPRRRRGVALVEVEQFVADVPVGPGSAPAASEPQSARGSVSIPSLGAIQVLSQSLAYSRTESPRHYPDNDRVLVSRVAAWISDAPPYGIASFAIDGGEQRQADVDHPVVAGARSLDNGIIAVRADSAGAVTLERVADGRRIEPLFEFIDEADVGDLYTPAPRARAFTVRFRGMRRAHRGPLRGQLTLGYYIDDERTGSRGRIAAVLIHLILDANASFVRVHVAGVNRSRNHRLRIVFRSDVTGGDVWADAAFSVIRREPIVVDQRDSAMEHAPPTAPLHRYLSHFNASVGATLFSDGLAEYEAMENGSTAVTLVRAVGQLSRNDLPERPGHAGWPSPTPRAQCLGRFKAGLAVLLHGARDAATIDEIERTADDVLNPLTGVSLRSALSVPMPVVGVELVGRGLGFSAMKESDDGEWLVLRCVNLTDDLVNGEWRLPFAVREAYLSRLDETLIEPWSASGRSVAFRAPPRGIVTILIKR